MPPASKVFISYARGDEADVGDLVARLRERGVDVWIDSVDIPGGSRWDDEIEKALRTCSSLLVALSPRSVASTNVRDELGEALDRQVPIFPVLIGDCEVPFRIKRLQQFDLARRPDDFDRLVSALRGSEAVSGAPLSASPPAAPTRLDVLAYEIFTRLDRMEKKMLRDEAPRREIDTELWHLGERIDAYEQLLASEPNEAHAAAVRDTRSRIVEGHDLTALAEFAERFARLSSNPRPPGHDARKQRR